MCDQAIPAGMQDRRQIAETVKERAALRLLEREYASTAL